ncbi:TOBE domain-containing protein [Veronia nyctiphanis]|nr:TOBE domain-containing protein [Veronia nyctiphanis]
MNLDAELVLSHSGKLFANPKRMVLLNQIRQTGSLNQAAKAAGISYKAAWDAINGMNHAFDKPIVISAKGGKGGGGATLTTFGLRLLKVYHLTQQVQGLAMNALQDENLSMDNLLDLLAHFSLQTSARNQFSAEIKSLLSEGLRDTVNCKLTNGQEIAVSITHASRLRLGLSERKSVLLMLKAPAVTLKSQSDISGSKVSDALVSHVNTITGELVNKVVQEDNIECTLNIGHGEYLYSLMNNTPSNDAMLLCGRHYDATFHVDQTIIASINDYLEE